eukprot:6183003-Pleurochrysis_carterae.AAC.5
MRQQSAPYVASASVAEVSGSEVHTTDADLIELDLLHPEFRHRLRLKAIRHAQLMSRLCPNLIEARRVALCRLQDFGLSFAVHSDYTARRMHGCKLLMTNLLLGYVS